MSTKLEQLVNDFVNDDEQATFDGKNDYVIADTFLKQNDIRANNKQVWSFIDAVKNSAGEEADW